MNKKQLIGFFGFLAILSSCGQPPRPAMTSEYKTHTVVTGNKELKTEYTAVIQGTQSVEIRPQVGGVITQILIEEGAPVKKGQVMFVIDQVPYKAALEVAKANVKSAQAQVATAQLNTESRQKLYKQKVVSDYDLQTAKNSLLVAKAALAQAEANQINAQNNLNYTRVTSPVSGTTSMIPYRVGALVSSGIAEPLVKVSDDSAMHTYFSLSEATVLTAVKKDTTTNNIMDGFGDVALRLADNTIYDVKGRVDAISGTVDPSTGTVGVRATFENPHKMLKSGGNGKVIITTTKENCVIVPIKSTFDIQNKIFVYKVVDGKAQSTEIKVYPTNNGTEYIVESGVEAGDQIIADGVGLIIPGMPIKIAGSTPEATEKPKAEAEVKE